MRYARYYVTTALLILSGVMFRLSPEHLGGFPDTGPAFTGDDARYSLGRVVTAKDLAPKLQSVEAEILTGAKRGERITVEHGSSLAITETQLVRAGQHIVIAEAEQAGEQTYFIADAWRLSPILAIALLFLAIAVLFGGRRGAFAVIGCGLSVTILVSWVVPMITSGTEPFLASMLGTLAIATISILVSHGFKRRTVVALLATVLTLAIAAGLAKLFVNLAGLTGAGTEEAFFLQFGALGKLNIKGLLLAGIMIGVLGVLDDVTTAQAAAVEELKRANPRFSFADLYERGISIGAEHIASLVNTLVLAYAGASFPLFLLFTAARTQPLWVVLNSESVAEEIIRALIGSSALVLAVPLTTLIAAWTFQHYAPEDAESHHH